LEVVETDMRKDLCGRRYCGSQQIQEISGNYNKSDLTQLAFAVRVGFIYGKITIWMMYRRCKAKKIIVLQN
jgi:hypothetical protein